MVGFAEGSTPTSGELLVNPMIVFIHLMLTECGPTKSLCPEWWRSWLSMGHGTGASCARAGARPTTRMTRQIRSRAASVEHHSPCRLCDVVMRLLLPVVRPRAARTALVCTGVPGASRCERVEQVAPHVEAPVAAERRGGDDRQPAPGRVFPEQRAVGIDGRDAVAGGRVDDPVRPDRGPAPERVVPLVAPELRPARRQCVERGLRPRMVPHGS